jgi:hypothetical protein
MWDFLKRRFEVGINATVVGGLLRCTKICRKIEMDQQSNPLPPTVDGQRRERAKRIREHYVRGAKRMDVWNRALTCREQIGLVAGFVWLMIGGHYANPNSSWISNHPFVLAFGF